MDVSPHRPAGSGAQPPADDEPPKSFFGRVRRFFLGKPKDIQDPHLFQHITLVAFLAWVGLGADGLSSSSYGPEEAFKALGQGHGYLAVFLALATAFTVLIIAMAYSKIIEHFPFGGGGYVVATKLLGAQAGLVSGAALVIDYVLTITTSIAGGGEAIFSLLPKELHAWKIPVEVAGIAILTIMNLRGTKESVRALVPIFLTFVACHVVVLVASIGMHLGAFGAIASSVSEGLSRDLIDPKIGALGLMAVFLRAYSMGAGTYTGIEAVSNGLQIMAEPRVATAKRTMLYMAVSLAVTAGGIILAYLLMGVHHEEGRTMNWSLVDMLAGKITVVGLPVGHWFVIITLLSEALLLFVAAQAGFIDGPRVMANMAHDSWLPHRFSALSDRLTMQNGVILMGVASLLMLLKTGGQVDALVVLYAINVFVTFSLSQAGMIRYWLMKATRTKHPDWKSHIWIHLVGFLLCFSILIVNIWEKFGEGAWLTVVVTGALVALCMLIRMHYRGVQARLKRLDEILTSLPQSGGEGKDLPLDKTKPTAALLVGGYSGLGIHSLLTVLRLFPRYFNNVIFMSVGVVDSATFQGIAEVERVQSQAEEGLKQYVALARRMGMPAEYRVGMGTEAVQGCEKLAAEVAGEFPRTIFFGGKLVFEQEKWWDRFLHNETAYAIQRRLQFSGLAMVILPVRVLE